MTKIIFSCRLLRRVPAAGVTFVACLWCGLEWGLLAGIGVNLSLLLYTIATPALKVTIAIPNKGKGETGVKHCGRNKTLFLLLDHCFELES